MKAGSEKAPDRHERERQIFGGEIQWEAAAFGWLAALGLAALLVAISIGAGAAVGLTELGSNQPGKELSFAGGIVLVLILATAYGAGGYVAARMARFDGMRQGLGVWLCGLFVTVALGLTAWIAGGDINPLESLSLPRIPVDEGDLTRGGAIVTAAVSAVTLAAALLGGRTGEAFHRVIDAAGDEPDVAMDETAVQAEPSGEVAPE